MPFPFTKPTKRSCDFGNKLVRNLGLREGFPTLSRQSLSKVVTAALVLAGSLLVVQAFPAFAQEAAKEPAYRQFPVLGSRLAVWAVAQLHLNFAAFILGVPIFAVIIEIIGWRTRDAK